VIRFSLSGVYPEDVEITFTNGAALCLKLRTRASPNASLIFPRARES
jgi:hypothetical protein